MTRGELQNEIYDRENLVGSYIALKLLIYEFGMPRPDSFTGILSTSSIFKDKDDLENEVTACKTWANVLPQ